MITATISLVVLLSMWSWLCLCLRNHGMGDTSIKFEVIPGKNQKSEYVMTCGKHTVRGWCKYNHWCNVWISSSSLPVLLCCPFWGCLFSHQACCVPSCSSLVYQFWLTQVSICCYHHIRSWYWYTSMVIFTGKNKRVGKQLASQKILQLLHPHVKNWGSLLRMYGRENSKLVKQVSRPLCEYNLPCGWSFASGFVNLVTTKLEGAWISLTVIIVLILHLLCQN